MLFKSLAASEQSETAKRIKLEQRNFANHNEKKLPRSKVCKENREIRNENT